MAHDKDKAADKAAAPDPATLPGGASFDYENASAEDFGKHEEILRRRQSVANLTAAPAAVPGTLPGAPVAAPATFTPPSAELITKWDSLTGLPQHLTAKQWDILSDEDKARFSDVEVQPAKPADLNK